LDVPVGYETNGVIQVKSCWKSNDGKVVLYCIDCAKILPHLEKIDAIITDPPYQIGKKTWERTFFGKNGKSRLWGKEQEWDKLNPVVPTLPTRSKICVIWGGNFYPLPPSRCWFIWDKLQSNRGADCEMAWVNIGKVIPPKVFRMSRIDAYVNKAETSKAHPTEKPLPLMLTRIRT